MMAGSLREGFKHQGGAVFPGRLFIDCLQNWHVNSGLLSKLSTCIIKKFFFSFYAKAEIQRFSIHWFTLQMPVRNCSSAVLKPGSRNSSRSPIWAVGTQYCSLLTGCRSAGGWIGSRVAESQMLQCGSQVSRVRLHHWAKHLSLHLHLESPNNESYLTSKIKQHKESSPSLTLALYSFP